MIGERIRTYRNMFGATQQDLADAMDVTRQTVAAWESGSRDLGVAMLLRIAKTIGIPVSALLEEDPYLVVVDAQDLAHLVQVALRHEEITESKARELLSGKGIP
jgi:transcriptional regulator with XRE-family HTH domain